MSTRTMKRTIAVLTAATALWAVGSTSASAHSGLTSSIPVDGAIVTEAPAAIAFTFDEELLADADSISLNAADGSNVVSAKVQPTGDTVELPWPAGLAAGDYQAAYRVVSADGHPVTGAISFTYAPESASAVPSAGVSAAPSLSAVPISETTEPESTGGNPWLGLGIGVAIGLLLVVIFAAMRRKRS